MRFERIVGVMCIYLVFLGGCVRPDASGASALRGLWRTAGPSLCVSVSAEEVQTGPQEGTIGQLGVRIDADGSFDLPIVLYDEFGAGVERLRAKGDRVYDGSTPDTSAVYLEVESCTYSSTCSEVVIGAHHKEAAKNVTTLLSAQLIPPNRMLFVFGLFGPGTEDFVGVEVLERMGAEAEREYDTMTHRAMR